MKTLVSTGFVSGLLVAFALKEWRRLMSAADEQASTECPACDGVGAMAGAHTEAVNPCPECDGTGRKKSVVRM